MKNSPKYRAAEAALDFVSDGMTLGLGTGSTAAIFIDLLADKAFRHGWELKAIPTSEASRLQAEKRGLTVIQPDETTRIDVAIDGADEVDPAGNLIKGGGAAHLREKIIAQQADKFVVIADPSKEVSALGDFGLPIEVDPFSYSLSVQAIRSVFDRLGYKGVNLSLRALEEGGVLLSDGGHYVLDARGVKIKNPAELDRALTIVPGVVTTGLFCAMADVVLIGETGGVRRIDVMKGQN